MWSPTTVIILVLLIFAGLGILTYVWVRILRQNRLELLELVEKSKQELSGEGAEQREKLLAERAQNAEQLDAFGERLGQVVVQSDAIQDQMGRLEQVKDELESASASAEEAVRLASTRAQRDLMTWKGQVKADLVEEGDRQRERLIVERGQNVAEIASSVSRLEAVATSTDVLLRTVQGGVTDELEQVLQSFVTADPALIRRLSTSGSVSADCVHINMPLLMTALKCRLPVWLYGDAGSGKSFSCEIAAARLGFSFGFISVCPTTTKSDFLGYRDGYGNYHSTEFRRCFEFGGVFLIDEIDNGNPQVLGVVNNALSNGLCAFPDKKVRRHPNCVIVAAANTIGRGANMRYVGRSPVDATTLDRFVFVRMDIDEQLESALAGCPVSSPSVLDLEKGGSVGDAGWLARVRGMRRAVADLGIDHMISPRATLNGRRLLEEGLGLAHVEEMVLWKGMRAGDRRKIVGKMARAA